jgi:hypothetical protein
VGRFFILGFCLLLFIFVAQMCYKCAISYGGIEIKLLCQV